ncbi:extracellular solute-binding protein family 3 [Methanolacinia petrolearia DSM 11571]|uniref:Extracellular solute-binding protein family 3 n=1 Tax=Methanolacinia petrolearia (strain DSM 11571 / OCM 486 / SEBR 4847) TaxID=679926 RepID=E1RGG9_METP4|nr:transporter substrate-binding domain-containing protein [Methanolacinia petrolearia]ADN35180.1 extracellular solute-binding protein family 3 [Methanolacinia petrolearia DSM 11571]
MTVKVYGAILVLILALAMVFSGCTDTSGENQTSTDGVNVEETTTYIVGIDGEYKPYSYVDTDGNPVGFDVDSIKWIAEKEGFEVEIIPVAWDGIIPALMAGKIDMVYSGMTITDKRLEQVNFSIPYWKVNQSVAINDVNNYTMDDFMSGKYIIGAQSGTSGAQWVEENLIDTGIMPAENFKNTYSTFPLVSEDLKNQRIDFAIYDKPPMLEAIEGKPLSIIGEIDTNEEYGVAIRKSDVELLETINDGLTQLMADPYWEELKTEYGMVE